MALKYPNRNRELHRLQNEWYAKLKETGFKDIEFYSYESGFGQDAPYLKGSAFTVARRMSEHTLNHYLYCQNYLTHAPKLPKLHNIQPKLIKFMFQLYCEGITYRNIIKLTHKKFRHPKWKRISLRPLCWLIRDLVQRAYKFNREHPEGMLYKGSQDILVEEVLIKDVEAPQNKDPLSLDYDFDTNDGSGNESSN
jgi:hypothetical protein